MLLGMVGASSLSCSSDDTGAGAVDPKDCDAVSKRLNSLSVEAGCDGSEPNGCNQVYATKQCVSEWEATVNCISTKSGSDFQCDNGNIEPKAGVCASQVTALNRCFGDE